MNFTNTQATIGIEAYLSIEEDLDTPEQKAEAYKLLILNQLTSTFNKSENKHINSILRLSGTNTNLITNSPRENKKENTNPEPTHTINQDNDGLVFGNGISSFNSSGNSSGSGHSDSDLIKIVVQICGYGNEEHVYNTVNKQLLSIGYSTGELYDLFEQYRDDIDKFIRAPEINCFGESRAVGIACGIIKRKQRENSESDDPIGDSSQFGSSSGNGVFDDPEDEPESELPF